jgi:hypothetical protein
MVPLMFNCLPLHIRFGRAAPWVTLICFGFLGHLTAACKRIRGWLIAREGDIFRLFPGIRWQAFMLEPLTP